jgi:hypothetical protein
MDRLRLAYSPASFRGAVHLRKEPSSAAPRPFHESSNLRTFADSSHRGIDCIARAERYLGFPRFLLALFISFSHWLFCRLRELRRRVNAPFRIRTLSRLADCHAARGLRRSGSIALRVIFSPEL